MIDKAKARQIAQDYINSMTGAMKGNIIIWDELTKEKSYGWIFFANTRKFIETRHWKDGLTGNGPIIVERANGILHQLGTAKAPSEYIDEFEQRFKIRAEGIGPKE